MISLDRETLILGGIVLSIIFCTFLYRENKKLQDDLLCFKNETRNLIRETETETISEIEKPKIIEEVKSETGKTE